MLVPHSLSFTIVIWTISFGSMQTALAEQFELSESYTNTQTFQVQAQVKTTGKVLTTGPDGKQTDLELKATAAFEFKEHRLPPGGRDADAFRAVREFSAARSQTSVGGRVTEFSLPEDRMLIVSGGKREGVVHYSPSGPLMRDALDLLDLPGDPLTILALLPPGKVEIEETWKPADWAVQMLTGIEAVESSELTCTVAEANSISAKVTYAGNIKGQRLGTVTEVAINGAFIYDTRTNHISQAQVIYKIKAEVGTVNPGLEAAVTSQIIRTPTTERGKLSDSFLEGIPFDPDPELMTLNFNAVPWGLKLQHGRDWHLFQAVYEGQGQVAILRLVDAGSLISQCNVSPIAKAAAGQHTPLDQFESDIQMSLGKRFKSFVGREQIPVDDGRMIFRVMVDGEVMLEGKAGTATLPMNWIYYLIADPQGNQASFVFSIEPNLLEQLGTKDRDIVSSTQFYRP